MPGCPDVGLAVQKGMSRLIKLSLVALCCYIPTAAGQFNWATFTNAAAPQTGKVSLRLSICPIKVTLTEVRPAVSGQLSISNLKRSPAPVHQPEKSLQDLLRKESAGPAPVCGVHYPRSVSHICVVNQPYTKSYRSLLLSDLSVGSLSEHMLPCFD